MAILFFDGFDRCTITKQLDRNYWSFQPQVPVEYEKYAFGGYSYDHTQEAYYTSIIIMLHIVLIMVTYLVSKNQATNSNINTFGTQHPAFGSPLGFLALNNIDISDSKYACSN